MPAPIKALIADDHPIVRYGLKQLLNAESDIHVVGEARNTRELTQMLRTLAPEVVVLDLEMVEAGDLHALRAIHVTARQSRLIVYTTLRHFKQIATAVELGAQVHLLKDSTIQELVGLIRSVYKGATILEPAVASRLLKHMRCNSRPGRRMGDDLSPRQRQVLVLVAAGKTNRTIATQLCISERTVKFHVSTILTQLQAKNRVEAVLNAAKLGLVRLGHVPERRRSSLTQT